MADNKTKIFLTVHPTGNEKPEMIELCEWTDEQKTDFLKSVKTYTPIRGLLVTDKCSCNVHCGSSIIHASSFTDAREFTPSRPTNKPNTIIIEIIPDKENPLCRVSTPHGCMDCLRENKCPSPFISNMILGQILPKTK